MNSGVKVMPSDLYTGSYRGFSLREFAVRGGTRIAVQHETSAIHVTLDDLGTAWDWIDRRLALNEPVDADW